MKLCSACLLGVKCRYDGNGKPHDAVLKLAKKDTLIPVCPEQLGGLATPRPGSERIKDKVMTETGRDVTENFKKGAEETLRIAKIFNIKEAILKERSGACGVNQVYDGTFSGKVIKGEGVTTALLRKNGINVISEENL